jgi:hypothetical protein
VSGPCFSDEPRGSEVPPIYRELWETEFSLYHSPVWWRDLLRRSRSLELLECAEIDEGRILWEDDVLDNLERGVYLDRIEVDADEIVFGRAAPPYLTHFMLTARRR